MGQDGVPSILDLIRNPEQYLQGVPLRSFYRGIVEDVDDPDKLGRVRIRVESVWPTDTVSTDGLPWAEIAQRPGMATLIVPDKGDAITVFFQEGDSRFPVAWGTWFGKPGGVSDAPPAGIEETDTARALKGQDTGTGAFGTVFQEPADPYAATYPNNRVWRTKAGHLVELDDTEGAERINIAHGPSGTWIEIHPNGTIVFGGQKKWYAFTQEDTKLHAKTSLDLLADTNLTAKGSEKVQMESGAEFLRKSGTKMEDESTTSYKLLAGSTIELQALQSLSIQSAAGMTLEDAVSILLKALEVKAEAPSIIMESPQVVLGNIAPAPVVTTLTHPNDYITGLPIVGTPIVRAG